MVSFTVVSSFATSLALCGEGLFRHHGFMSASSSSIPSPTTSDAAPSLSGTTSLPLPPTLNPKKRGRSSSSPLPLLRRTSTLYSTTSTSSQSSEGAVGTSAPPLDAVDALKELEARAHAMNQRASEGVPLTMDEVQDVVLSIRNLRMGVLLDEEGKEEEEEEEKKASSSWDEARLQTFLLESAHCSHKDWALTDANSEKLSQILFGVQDHSGSNNPAPNNIPDRFDALAPQLFQRILTDGNWVGALEHARQQQPNPYQPWAVLVTGVNGIRKTTSMYQPWFATVLSEALVVPTVHDTSTSAIPDPQLPTGPNSFFRQLDHMIATLCNHDFERLYQLTSLAVQQENAAIASDDQGPVETAVSPEIVQAYTNLKAALFSRYRTLSELLGALLLKQAQRYQLNCLMETSGKDIAMFQYVDYFLPHCRKLALRFQINDLSLAQVSVDARMINEIQCGMAARTTMEVIASNQGGPYGSQVLPSVQQDSDTVWEKQVLTRQGVGKDWFMATIQITAHRDRPWTAQAIQPDGTLGTLFEFQR